MNALAEKKNLDGISKVLVANTGILTKVVNGEEVEDSSIQQFKAEASSFTRALVHADYLKKICGEERVGFLQKNVDELSNIAKVLVSSAGSMMGQGGFDCSDHNLVALYHIVTEPSNLISELLDYAAFEVVCESRLQLMAERAVAAKRSLALEYHCCPGRHPGHR